MKQAKKGGESYRIKPKLGRDWLRRMEDEGETPPIIAKKDGFDVRSVRKYIEKARQERELKEARVIVFREALSEHYRDLCNLVHDIDSEINHDLIYLERIHQEPLFPALKQHLSTSSLWKGLEKLERLEQQHRDSEKEFRRSLTTQLEAEPTGLSKATITGLVEALVFQTLADIQGIDRLNWEEKASFDEMDENRIKVHLGHIELGEMSKEKMDIMRQLFIQYQGKMEGMASYIEMRNTLSDLVELKSDLHQELLAIQLKRILPSKCRYCPI